MVPARHILPWALSTALAAPASAASQDFLVPFWGSDLAPREAPGGRAVFQLDQFTELDNARRRFPLHRPTDTCAAYCETVGFNTLQASRAWRAPGGTLLAAAVHAGLADDRLTGFLQNEYSHARAGIAPVPREGVREGFLFGIAAEADRRPSWTVGLYGAGISLNNAYYEAYLHASSGDRRHTWGAWSHGLKYAATARLGAIAAARERLIAGDPFFDRLFPAYLSAQAETGLVWKPFGVPLEFSWRGGYALGPFEDPESGRPVGLWLEGLKTVVWRFAFERYNDALNGTDYGPTYGVKAAWSLDP